MPDPQVPATFAGKLLAGFKCAFNFTCPMDPDIERASRRYFGLSVLGIGILLSTWMWTLQNSSYTAALNDLLLKAKVSEPALPAYARNWAIGLYAVDSLIFIACYFGFGVLIARQLNYLLKQDLALVPAAGDPPSGPRWARLFAKIFLFVAAVLLLALVVSDAAENVAALLPLLSGGKPVIAASAVLGFSTPAKTYISYASGIWSIAAALVWVTGVLTPRPAREKHDDPRPIRRSIRDGLLDVLARTRYCTLMVAAYAVIMLGIDQAQDVLGGLASFQNETLVIAAMLLFAVALGVFALHTFSHAIWVWIRLLVRLKRPYAATSAAGGPVATFAKWWGRLMGAAPWFIILVLCVRTAGTALDVGDTFTALMLLFAGLLASGWGSGFILYKEYESTLATNSGRNHYAADDDEAKILKDPAYSFLKFIKPSPVWIPLVAVVGIVLVRALFVFNPDSVACHALAGISFGFALWTCVINRLALNSLRSRFPWITALIIVIAGLAQFGLTQNHGLLSGASIDLTSAGAASLHHMFLLTLCLTLGAGLAYVLWTNFQLRLKTEHRMLWAWALVVVWTGVVLLLASGGQKQASDFPAAAELKRSTLQEAVTTWLRTRAKDCEATGCSKIPVYLVSAEGGGIRAAYYSARLLSELSSVHEMPDGQPFDFSSRVFSLSGVSGGSLGVMAWRLCLDKDAKAMPGCVQPLGGQDLLTPLASAWLYEDALALILPTGKCDLPGCGFVDRGSWFERSLENGIPEFAGPLPGAAPYVFLNSTWVETGERSIASNVQIESRHCVDLRHQAVKDGSIERGTFKDCHPQFPTARDQLFEVGEGVRASTLAHNSARFPYFNPIGYVKEHGHLADGGYFDNSGNQTTADVLNEFARQLAPAEIRGRDPVDLTEEERIYLRGKVAITAIMIRNGVRDNGDPSESNCAAPRPKIDQNLFANAAGPLITALNATGIGTPNRVAQCNLQRVLTRLGEHLTLQKDEGGYFDVRLLSEKTLYPLGWYLSRAARDGIENAAHACVVDQHLAERLAVRAAEPPPSPESAEVKPEPPLGCFDRVL